MRARFFKWCTGFYQPDRNSEPGTSWKVEWWSFSYPEDNNFLKAMSHVLLPTLYLEYEFSEHNLFG